jgi:hypothetical protein
MRLGGAVFRAIVISDKNAFRPLMHKKQGGFFELLALPKAAYG